MKSDTAALVGDGEVAESVTFTPAGGSGSTVSGILGPITKTVQRYGDGVYEVSRRSWTIEVADVATVSSNDAVTIGSDAWAIEGVAFTSRGGWHQVNLVRRVRLRAEPQEYELHP